MTLNNLAMQFQSDLLQVPVIKSDVMESTALGAAFAAGRTINYWSQDLKQLWSQGDRWNPKMKQNEVNVLLERWQKGIKKSKNWIEEVDEPEERSRSQSVSKVLTASSRSLISPLSWMIAGASITVAMGFLIKSYRK